MPRPVGGKKKKVPTHIAPENNIGPAYTLLAFILLSVGLFLLYLRSGCEKGVAWVDLGVFGVIALLFLSIARPEKFDSVFRTIADKLPFLAYKKDV